MGRAFSPSPRVGKRRAAGSAIHPYLVKVLLRKFSTKRCLTFAVSGYNNYNPTGNRLPFVAKCVIWTINLSWRENDGKEQQVE